MVAALSPALSVLRAYALVLVLVLIVLVLVILVLIVLILVVLVLIVLVLILVVLLVLIILIVRHMRLLKVKDYTVIIGGKRAYYTSASHFYSNIYLYSICSLIFRSNTIKDIAKIPVNRNSTCQKDIISAS